MKTIVMKPITEKKAKLPSVIIISLILLLIISLMPFYFYLFKAVN